MPVPVPLWWGQLDRPWWALLQPRLPGDRIDALQAPLLDELVALIELQAGLGLVLGKAGWKVSWWIDVVVFEGWEGWWNGAEQAAPHTARRLRAFLEPARGSRLPVADLVHGDFGIGNVLAQGGAVIAVVDWDHLGVGSRALDLASLLFDWQRLRLASPASAAPDGGERLGNRIVEIAGEHGLRSCVCYAAIARLALCWQHGQQDDVDMWRAVTESILDTLEALDGDPRAVAFPLYDRKAERANPDLAGRPVVVRGSTQVFFPGIRRVQENTVINTKNKSHSVTAEIEVPLSGAKGVIVAQGGWAMYAYDGRLRYYYNLLGARRAAVTSDSSIPAGAHQVRMEFAYDGGGLGKGANITLFCDGKQIGKGRLERTHLFAFGLDETLEVGCDLGEPVSEDYGARGNDFNGRVNWVQIDIDAAAKDVDHMIGEEERFRFAMARQ